VFQKTRDEVQSGSGTSPKPVRVNNTHPTMPHQRERERKKERKREREREREESHLLACFIGLAYQGKDIVFRFIIEYSSLRDFGS
jgi:hypothetical protein